MRTPHWSSQFKKDFKRESKGTYRKTIEAEIVEVSTLLANDIELPFHFKDHPLTGEWKGYRDCHVHPDLVLIYEKIGDVDGELHLARLASHAELGW